MKTDAFTNNTHKLINAIDKAIKDSVLKTWEKVLSDKNETLCSHMPGQCRSKAMPQPHVYADKLTFNTTWWSKIVIGNRYSRIHSWTFY